MGKQIVRRAAQLVPILFCITFLSFATMRAAGGDAVSQKMENTGMVLSREVMAAARAELGLDKPFLVQYAVWLRRVLRGDMGKSYISGRDVFSTFVSKLPATITLAALSIALTVLVSVPLGVWAAVRQNKAADYAVRFVGFAGNAMPNFFVALLLMYFFSLKLGLFPVIADGTGFKSAALPALTLAVAMSAKYTRQVRAAVLDELNKGYVAGAAARGVPFRVTLATSVLKCSLPTIVTLLSLSVGSLLGGTAIVESIFMWDGVGKLAADAIRMRDYPMIQAYVMWMAVIYVGVNLVADLSYQFLDPRVRLGGERR